ncbi:MAG: response regulator transcription factor [Deltaproteobacteria bacterium]|nr:response regulator transcription factor [Deltaproteobacteria bacterium]
MNPPKTVKKPKPWKESKPPLSTSKILIVDDHPIVREGLRRRIESQPDLEVGCEAGDAAEAWGCLEKAVFDAAVIDISLGGSSGIDLLKQIRARGLTFPVLILSVHDDATYLDRALAAGAQGYIVKHEAPPLIIAALHRILAGGMYICDSMATKFFSRLDGRKKKADNPLSLLSDREIEILEAVSRGKTSREIAAGLFLSPSTIDTYKSRIKTKLGLKNSLELIVFATKAFNLPNLL